MVTSMFALNPTSIRACKLLSTLMNSVLAHIPNNIVTVMSVLGWAEGTEVEMIDTGCQLSSDYFSDVGV